MADPHPVNGGLKILYLQTELPCPPVSGSRMRGYHLIRALSLKNSVTLVAFQLPETTTANVAAMSSICDEIIPVPFARRHSLAAFLRSMISGRPYKVIQYYSAEFDRRVRDLTSTRKFDVIIAENVYMGQYIPTNSPCAIPQNNDMVARLYERMIHAGNFTMRLYARTQWKKMLRFETELFRRFGVFIALSSQERAAAQALIPGIQTVDIANGVDAEFFSPNAVKPLNFAVDIVFTGLFSYYPNEQAALYFVSSILPIIRKRRPHTNFFVVGREPGRALRVLSRDSSIQVTGFVEDVRPYLNMSSVVVAPLLLGTGTRLKILEAMAMGKAVVSTTVGCEGLEVDSGKNILIADTPEEFAGHVLELLENEDKRRSLGAQARTLIENKYRWETIGGKFAAFVAELAKTKTNQL